MPFTARFFVAGDPVPKGSKKGFIFVQGPKGKRVVVQMTPAIAAAVGSPWTARPIVAESTDGREKTWARAVKVVASANVPPGGPISGAVRLSLRFFLSRPKSVSEKSRPYPIVKPDRDKLERNVGDALTGIIYTDDCVVIGGEVTKHYADGDGERPGVEITVEELPC